MRYLTTISLGIVLLGFLLFVSFQTQGIYGGDSGDLVTAAVTFGVPHPPGYPLFVLLGFIASKVPLSTPAWRVGLLSSIPHAVTLALVFVVVLRITGRIIPALLSVFMLAGNYLFFLYSVTPEVFALLDLFVSLLLLISIRFYETKNIMYAYIAVFVFGLSLSHHHVILFLVPSLLYLAFHAFYKKTAGLKKIIPVSVLGIVFFLSGLLPYLYVPVAARQASMINWDRAVDIGGFIRLITRTDYGTFVSGGYFGSQVAERLLALKAYVQFVYLDFSWQGVLLAVSGMVYLYKSKRRIFSAFGLAFLFLGPFFFFYASFPLMNRFTLGTYERFLLPSYIILSILSGIGLSGILKWFERTFKIVKRHGSFILIIIALLFFLFPAGRMYSTVWRFWTIAEDKTGDHLGIDMLSSLPPNSVLLLSQDTPLFITQYVRYALDFRSDTVVLHAHLLENPEYGQTIKNIFPQIHLPLKSDSGAAVSFLRDNAGRFPIFTNRQIPSPSGWFWVPRGMSYELTKEENLPKLSDLAKDNDAIWNRYHDPSAGILSRYNHLMLADVRDVYAGARIAYGKILLRGNQTHEAQKQFEEAVSLHPDTYGADGYTYLGLTYLFEGTCDKAAAYFKEARRVSLVPDSSLILYEASLARDCDKNPVRARELLDLYEKEKKVRDIPLQ